jgi:hypothetical protein
MLFETHTYEQLRLPLNAEKPATSYENDQEGRRQHHRQQDPTTAASAVKTSRHRAMRPIGHESPPSSLSHVERAQQPAPGEHIDGRSTQNQLSRVGAGQEAVDATCRERERPSRHQHWLCARLT